MVQTVNLNECGELLQDLLSDAKEYDSRSLKRGEGIKLDIVGKRVVVGCG